MKKLADFKTVYWNDGKVRMIDQTKLPLVEKWIDLEDHQSVAEAIKNMRVRGAPAIGVTAAFGIALAASRSSAPSSPELVNELDLAGDELSATRPTAVNLFWAVKRMRLFIYENRHLPVDDLKAAIINEAISIQEEDIERNKMLGGFGADLMGDGDNILTHCNAGALACAGYGTALGVIRAAWERGKRVHVFVDETRPLLQGARLTAWELKKEGIPLTLITDNTAGHMMRLGKIQKVVVGADRIAANGDTANKIGTYTVAMMAAAHEIPFYVAAPTSTIDSSIADGSMIPIEERSPTEVTGYDYLNWAPRDIDVANPAFDVTPHNLIAAIITEKGVIKDPYSAAIQGIFSSEIVLD